MQVTRETQFRPITIIIESKEEADILWNLLNMAKTNIIIDALHKYHLYPDHPYPILSNTSTDMFNKLDDVL